MGGIVGRFRTGLAVGESRPKHDWPRTRAAPTALPAGPQPVCGSDIFGGKPGLCWQVAHDREVIAPSLGSTARAKRGKWQHKPFPGGDDSYQGCGDACGITPWTCSHAAQALRKAQGATRIGLWHKRSMHGLMTLACWSGCFWPKTRPALATRLKHCRWPCQAATSFLPTRLVPAAPLAQLLSARRQALCQYRTQAPYRMRSLGSCQRQSARAFLCERPNARGLATRYDTPSPNVPAAITFFCTRLGIADHGTTASARGGGSAYHGCDAPAIAVCRQTA